MDQGKKTARIKRRSLLKTGAVVAPLAITLYGGISLAHADSTDCVEELEKHEDIPHFNPDGTRDGSTEHFNPVSGLTGRINTDGTSETHWDYLVKEDKIGASCLQSIENSGNHHEFHTDPDSKHH